jgi:NADPH:quinone reductase-like Zn-dependent oxidoreductase
VAGADALIPRDGKRKDAQMKAVVYEKFGPPEVLQLKEVEKPTPKANEVLVKVHAASVNSWDWELLRGKPFVNRLLFGLLLTRT